MRAQKAKSGAERRRVRQRERERGGGREGERRRKYKFEVSRIALNSASPSFRFSVPAERAFILSSRMRR